MNRQRQLKKNAATLKRQASQQKRHDKVQEVHALKSKGYGNGQIAEFMGISSKTVMRLLLISPELMRTDGAQTRSGNKLLDPYRKSIQALLEQALLEQGFTPSQILRKLNESHPAADFKYSTLSDFCRELQSELFDFSQSQAEPELRENSLLAPYNMKIADMLDDGASLKAILAVITADGYTGSYSLIQQYCRTLRPLPKRTRKNTHKIKRKALSKSIWSGESALPDQDFSYIYGKYPALSALKSIISEFRTAYSAKDVSAVKDWCEKYAPCEFSPIRSFINGVNIDSEAFYNSLKYPYSNGLLEGSVNKLKTVKRSMFGRAGYPLLRAKLLLL